MKRQPFMILGLGLSCLTLQAVGCWGDSSSTDQAQSPAAPVAPPSADQNDPAGPVSPRGNRFRRPRPVEYVSPADKVAIRQAMLSQRKNKGSFTQDFTSYSIDAITTHGEAIVPTLIELLDDEDRYIRLQAAYSLGDVGPDAADAVPRLIQMLDGEDFEPGRAAEALGKIGPAARSAGPALVARVAQGNTFGFRETLVAIEKTGADTQDLEAALMKALRKSEPSPLSPLNLKHATAAIHRYGYDPEPAVSLLIARLNQKGDGDDPDAKFVAAALGELGPDAKAASPLLMKMLQTGDPKDGLAAADALEKMEVDMSVAVPSLLEALKTSEDDERAKIIEVLWKLGPAAAPAVPLLIEIITSEPKGSAVATKAVQFLGSLGPEAAPAVPALVEIAKSDDFSKNTRAIRALGEIGGPEVIDGLVETARSGAPAQEQTVLEALGNIGSPAVPALVELFQSDIRPIRVAEQLGEMGADAEAALPALEEARPGAKDSLRKAIDEAVEKVNADLAENRSEAAIVGPESGGDADAETTVAEPPPTPIVRTWTSGSGSFSVEAELVESEDGMVTLKRIDNGRAVTVPIDKLSQADQDFLAEQSR